MSQVFHHLTRRALRPIAAIAQTQNRDNEGRTAQLAKIDQISTIEASQLRLETEAGRAGEQKER